MATSAAPTELIAEVSSELRSLTSEIDGVDQRAALQFGLHPTDLRCLDIVSSRGPLTASEVGRAVGLSSGGTSIALERLERMGLIHRSRGTSDRRQVVVEVTSLTRQREQEIFGPMHAAMGQLLAGYSAAKLKMIRDVLRDMRAVIVTHGPGAQDSSGTTMVDDG